MPIYGIAFKGPAQALRSLEANLGPDSIAFTNGSRATTAKHPEYPKSPSPANAAPADTGNTEVSLMAGEEPWSPAYGSVSTYTDSEGWRCIYNELTWLGTSVLEFQPGEGYEHDFVTYNYDGLHWAAGLRGTLRGWGLGWESNLPAAYLDYATVDDKPEEPVYTVGTFDGTQLYSNTTYYTFVRAYPGNASSDTAKIVGQKMNVLAWSVWSVFAKASDFLTSGWPVQIEGTYAW